MKNGKLASVFGYAGLDAAQAVCRYRSAERAIRFFVAASALFGLYMTSLCAQAAYVDSHAFLVAPGEVTVELFFVDTTGAVGPFASSGATNFRDANTSASVTTWSSTFVNPNYLLLTGVTPPTGSLYTFDLNFLGDFLGSDGSEYFTVNALFFSGAPTAGNLLNVGERKVYSDDFISAGSGIPGSFGITFTGNSTLGVTFDRTPLSVPEPATLALFGLGLAGIPFVRRRRTPA